ncbi:MAG: hypothetical protein JW768_10965 [Chitinispirillaceae bacterium]|nr:hypothetical protein [Chitinispirillaceae bacterium]
MNDTCHAPICDTYPSIRSGGRRHAVGIVAAFVALLAMAGYAGAAQPSPPKERPCSSKQDRKYLGKDYIDSTVLRAIFIINDAASVAGIGFRTKESLNQARRIARKIRSEAKGDPNERYALWKVGELEWLIQLEERDLLLQKMKEGEATVNQIIADYNKEVGKSRPDFKTLTRMHGRMLEYDTRQANAMVGSINNRVRAISQEAVLRLERALLARNSKSADREFKYLLRNRPYLKISSRQFDELESRASACVRARDELPVVKRETDKAWKLVRQERLSEGRAMLDFARHRLSDIRSFIAEKEASRLYLGITEVDRALSRVEDSLVNVNLQILSQKGVKKANQYLQQVLREKGVCRDKVARVDEAILTVASPSSRRKSKAEKEIDDVAMAAERSAERNDVMEEIAAKARKKARLKLDSLRKEEEKRIRREKRRRDSIDAVARKAASEEFQKKNEQSIRIASKVYDLIEKNKGRVAYDLFSSKQSQLEKYLSSDAYAMLESTVREVGDEKWSAQSDDIFYLKPVDNGKSTAAPKAQSPPGNRERAVAIITEIYEMLERSDNRGASQRFEKEKPFLARYLDKEAYNMLSVTISHAR